MDNDDRSPNHKKSLLEPRARRRRVKRLVTKNAVGSGDNNGIKISKVPMPDNSLALQDDERTVFEPVVKTAAPSATGLSKAGFSTTGSIASGSRRVGGTPPEVEQNRRHGYSRRVNEEHTIGSHSALGVSGRFSNQKTMNESVPAEQEAALIQNPLLIQAQPLLVIASQFRFARDLKNLHSLRDSLQSKIIQFTKALERFYTPIFIEKASFCLCTFIDQCLLKNPGGTAWRDHSLLVEFHQTTHLELLFERIEQERDAQQEMDLLELYYTVLRLGYEGRLAYDHNVYEREHSQLLYSLLEIIKAERFDQRLPLKVGSGSRYLVQDQPKRGWLLVVMPVALLAFMLATFAVFSFNLNPRQAVVIEQLHQLGETRALAVGDFYQKTTESVPDYSVAINRLLSLENSKQLTLFRQTRHNGTRILLDTDYLFSSGSARLKPGAKTQMQVLAQVLDDIPGSIQIEGHTDNTRFKSGFGSNLQLSTDRAQSYKVALQQHLSHQKHLAILGRADNNPIACNTSKEGRSRNRRVEIILPSLEIPSLEPLPTPVCGL